MTKRVTFISARFSPRVSARLELMTNRQTDRPIDSTNTVCSTIECYNSIYNGGMHNSGIHVDSMHNGSIHNDDMHNGQLYMHNGGMHVKIMYNLACTIVVCILTICIMTVCIMVSCAGIIMVAEKGHSLCIVTIS